jgi:hypothetical protein
MFRKFNKGKMFCYYRVLCFQMWIGFFRIPSTKYYEKPYVNWIGLLSFET